jgi:transposase
VPWSEKSIMSQRDEFVVLFEQDGVNRRELCRRFGVSPTIGYRLWARYRQEGKAGLADRSRRPQRSPARTSAEIEERVLAVRDEHPAWGGRKIRRRLPSPGAEPEHSDCGSAPQWPHPDGGERWTQTI